MAKRQYNVTMDEETHKRLEDLATATKRSMSNLLEILIWNVHTLRDCEPRPLGEEAQVFTWQAQPQ